MNKTIHFFISTLTFFLFSTSVLADTLDKVKKRGVVHCGVSTGLPGFSEANRDEKWHGLDVDVCRAVAAAVLGDAKKVKYFALSAKERFGALQNGEVDLLSRNTTWTQTRDTTLGFHFAGVTYYDGQGFLVLKKLGVSSAKELDGASICIQAGTTTQQNLKEYFQINSMKYKAITFDTSDQTIRAFEDKRCDLLSSDASQLYSLRLKLKEPKEYKVLPEIISKEPLGPIVKEGDDLWFNIVRWSLNTMKAAEEFGITSSNINKVKKTTTNPEIKRILGSSGMLGKNLQLDEKWSYNIIKQVGNYGESFERNVGKKSPLKIKRGLNNIWTKEGGLHYSPPFR